MRGAGLVVAAALDAMREAVAPGVSTADLDAIAEEVIRDAGAVPSFKGYHGFPASICSSVNEQVVHAHPGRRAGAARGRPDLARLRRDPGRLARRRGDHRRRRRDRPGAAADGRGGRGRDVGRASPPRRAAPPTAGAGSPTSRSTSRRRSARAGRYGIVDGYGGHGIGTEMHQDPHVLNHGRPGKGPRLVPGLALAIEPMITMGSPRTVGARRRLDRGHPGRLDGRARRAHDGPARRRRLGDSPRRTAAGPGSATWSPPASRRWPSRSDRRMLDRMERDEMRAGDGDRQAVAEQLKTALDEGRLDLHEYDERLQQTYAAKTFGDLDGLVTDLPGTGPGAASGAAHRPAAPRRRPRSARCASRAVHRGWPRTAAWCGLRLIWAITPRRRRLLYFWPVWMLIPLIFGVIGRIGARGSRSADPGARWQLEAWAATRCGPPTPTGRPSQTAAGGARRGPARSARVRRAPAAGVRGEDLRRPGAAARRPAVDRAAGAAARSAAPPARRRRRRLTRRWLLADLGELAAGGRRSPSAIWLIASIAAGELLYFWPVWVAGPWGAVLVCADGRRPGSHEPASRSRLRPSEEALAGGAAKAARRRAQAGRQTGRGRRPPGAIEPDRG